MVKLTEVEDEHFSEKPATTKDNALLADDDDDYTDTAFAHPDDIAFPIAAKPSYDFPIAPDYIFLRSLALATTTPDFSVDLRKYSLLPPDSEISSDDLDSSPYSSQPNETIADRIYALRDIISPRARAQIASTTSSIYSITGSAITYGGKGLWILATSAFLLGIPYALALGQEQEIVEEEKRQGMMTEGASGLLQPSEAAGEIRQSL